MSYSSHVAEIYGNNIFFIWFMVISLHRFAVLFCDPFYKGFICSLKSDKNYLCFSYCSDDSIRSQLCTCHNSWAVVICAKLGPDYIVGIFIGIRTTWFHQHKDCELTNSSWTETLVWDCVPLSGYVTHILWHLTMRFLLPMKSDHSS